MGLQKPRPGTGPNGDQERPDMELVLGGKKMKVKLGQLDMSQPIENTKRDDE